MLLGPPERLPTAPAALPQGGRVSPCGARVLLPSRLSPQHCIPRHLVGTVVELFSESQCDGLPLVSKPRAQSSLTPPAGGTSAIIHGGQQLETNCWSTTRCWSTLSVRALVVGGRERGRGEEEGVCGGVGTYFGHDLLYDKTAKFWGVQVVPGRQGGPGERGRSQEGGAGEGRPGNSKKMEILPCKNVPNRTISGVTPRFRHKSFFKLAAGAFGSRHRIPDASLDSQRQALNLPTPCTTNAERGPRARIVVFPAATRCTLMFGGPEWPRASLFRVRPVV